MATQTGVAEFEKNRIKNGAAFRLLPQKAICRKLFVHFSGSYFIIGGTQDEGFCLFFSSNE
jgi:hypothetical protein